MAEPTMDTLPQRLSTELPRSEEDVELAFTRDGNNFWLKAHSHDKDEDGDWRDLDFDLLTLLPGRGLILHDGIWPKLGLALGDNLRLKIINRKGEELVLIPAKDLQALTDSVGKALVGGEKKEKKSEHTLEVDGITYEMSARTDGLHIRAMGYAAGHLLTIGKKVGILRMESVAPDLGFPLNEKGAIQVTR